MRSVAVIGGGAAGLAAAISAARCGAHVTVLEGGDRVGRKILATGNGRCNLTNMNVSPDGYNAPGFVEPTLSSYGADRILAYFKQLGLLTHEERGGRVYPLSNSANSVLDALRLGCAALGVETVCNFRVMDLNRRGDVFVIAAEDGKIHKAQAAVIATGGGTDLLSMCGHTFAQFKPVLCALRTNTDRFRGLSGVRVQAQVNVFDRKQSRKPYASERGEVLFRDYGLSGIVIFDLSRMVEAGHIIALDLLFDMELRDVKAWLDMRYSVLAPKGGSYEPRNEDLLTGMFHPRVGACVLRAAGCRPANPASPDNFAAIAKACKDLRTKVTGTADPKHAQVTRGGALVDEFDPKTLESRKASGVFAAGETLNIDGRCGGYNLHWAWASGIVAGYNAATLLEHADGEEAAFAVEDTGDEGDQQISLLL